MRKLLNLFFRRTKLEHGLDRELQYHFDRLVDDFKRKGIDEIEARRRAFVELGGAAQIQEDVRDTWYVRWIDNGLRDLRFGIRTLRKSPAFTLTAVLSLSLGIAASTAIFSLFDQVLLRQLPVKDPQQLVLLDWQGMSLAPGWGSDNIMSYPLCRDMQAQTQFFDGAFCRHPAEVILSTGQQPHPAIAELVSGSYFPVLGVRPELGRLIDDSDDQRQDAHPVVVVSHTYWQNRMGAAPDVVGRKILLNNYPMTVIGVADPSFHGVDVGEVPDLWVPAMMKREVTPGWDRLWDRRARWMHVFGRLKPGVTAAQAQAGLQPWFKAMLQEDMKREGFPPASPTQLRGYLASTLTVTPAPQGWSNLRTGFGRPLWVLLAGTTLLLLLACLNVANLMLARGVARSREVSTRLALGASRGRVARQLLIEGLLISISGGLVGLLLSPVLARLLISSLSHDAATFALTADLNLRVFLAGFLVSLLAGLLCGLAPVLHIGKDALNSSLRDRSNTAGGSVGIRKVLVVCQVAFTLVLLVGAGLYVQTLAHLRLKGPGFETSGMVMFAIDGRSLGYAPAQGRQLIVDLLERLKSTPGVERAAVATNDLLSGGSWNDRMTLQVNGRTTTNRVVHCMRVTPDFFSVLGAKLIAGRDFNAQDSVDLSSKEGNTHSVIINERFAKRYFGDQSPLGHRLGLGSRPDTKTEIEIVGVVRDFSYRNLREETEQAFFPFWEDPGSAGAFYLKVRGKPEASFSAIRAAVARVDPAIPVVSPRTLDDQMNRALTTERILASLSTGFGVIALILSVVGLYGVMSYVVTHRTREIGIRMALGATRGTAVWLIVRDALILIAAGVGIALPCMSALKTLVQSQLYGVSALDVPTLLGSSVLLSAVALGAASLPAWRAASVSPMVSLHFD